MYSKQLEKKLNKIIKKYNFTQKSPYSDSYYTDGKIDWGSKPEGSLRLSDHWNFESQGKKHCLLSDTNKYVQEWLVCEYHNGVYAVIEKVFTDDEVALEERCKQNHINKIMKMVAREKAIEDKKKKMLETGGNYLIRYTTSSKSGRYITTKKHEEVCYCKGCWAYTSNGRKRSFELILK